MHAGLVLPLLVAGLCLCVAGQAIDFEELRQGHYKNVKSNCVNPRHAALTFDDGIHIGNAPRLLKILKKRNVKATFFILGKTLSRYSDLSKSSRNANYRAAREIVRQMVEDGHEVASHSFDHTVFTWLDSSAVSEQLDRTADLIQYATGKRPRLFRAPEGALTSENIRTFSRKGYTGVHWNVDPEDWKFHEWQPERMIETVRNEIPPAKRGIGPIILQHEIFWKTVEDQDKIISILQGKGYELVTMSVCLGKPAYD